MEIKNFLRICILSSLLLTAACMHDFPLRPRPAKSSSGSPSDLSEAVPFDPSGSKNEDSQAKKQKVRVQTHNQEKPYRPKVALILGPGMARSLSHIGLLKVLAQEGFRPYIVAGMGMSALPAYEFVSAGSVHGLEWRASRSPELKALSNLHFWNKRVQTQTLTDLQNLRQALLKKKSGSQSSFYCSLMDRDQNILFDQGKKLELCSAVPPLFDSGKSLSPYLFSLKEWGSHLRDQGAEKVIYIDLLSQEKSLWLKEGSKVDSNSYWYWKYVGTQLYRDRQFMDLWVSVDLKDFSLLDFADSLKMVRQGELAGKKLMRFLKEEYQY